MRRSSRDGERRDSGAIVVCSGSITLSLCMIRRGRRCHEADDVSQIKQGSSQPCDLRQRQHSALNRLRGHIFMTTVDLVVGYLRHSQTLRNNTALVAERLCGLDSITCFLKACANSGTHVGLTLTELSLTHTHTHTHTHTRAVEVTSNILDRRA